MQRNRAGHPAIRARWFSIQFCFLTDSVRRGVVKLNFNGHTN